ncbi:hypothetical protein ACFE04_025642 [Oxalis oulophora]
MSPGIKKSSSDGSIEKSVVAEEQQAKINEVRKLIGPLSEKLAIFCSDAQVTRYLRARNWHVKKATKMLKDTLKWRATYKPEEIRWEEVAHEAETGKIYSTDYVDKQGRTVLVMRPSRQVLSKLFLLASTRVTSLTLNFFTVCQLKPIGKLNNSKSIKGQIRYLVYCMENAIMNLPAEQEQMVWLIDFGGFSLSNISVKVTQETAHVLQDHYPERLGLAILYNPPKFFEPFWTMVKPFLEQKTRNKVTFVYEDNQNSKKLMEEVFNMNDLESAFGGNNPSGFEISKYAERMKEDDKKRTNTSSEAAQHPEPLTSTSLDGINLEDSDSDAIENEKVDEIPSDGAEEEKVDEITSEGADTEKNDDCPSNEIDSELGRGPDVEILPENTKSVAGETH